MSKFKVGDIIVNENGKEAEVLEVLTNTFLKSVWGDFDQAYSWYTFKEAENYSWKIKGEEKTFKLNGLYTEEQLKEIIEK